MKKLFIILFVLFSINGFSQTYYPVYKMKHGTFDGNTGKFDLNSSYVDMEILVENNILCINDSSYVLSSYNVEQISQMFTVKEYDAIDFKNRKCSVFIRFTKVVNDNNFIVIVYPNYIYQYFFRK